MLPTRLELKGLNPDVITADKAKFSQMPGAPIYIGRGPSVVEHGLTFVENPVWPHLIHNNKKYALQFIDTLKPIEAAHPNKSFNIIALGCPPFHFADYFGSHKGFWNSLGGVKWFSHHTDKGDFTFISKPYPEKIGSWCNLYHLQVYKDNELYFDAHVLNKEVGRRQAVYQLDEKVVAQVHRMTRDALEDKAVVVDHSGQTDEVAAETLFMGQLLVKELKEYPPSPEDVSKLVIEAQSVRCGMLGKIYNPGPFLEVNLPQAECEKKIAADLAKLDKIPENRSSMPKQNLITGDEVKAVFAEDKQLKEKARIAAEQQRARLKAIEDARKVQEAKDAAERKKAQEEKEAKAAKAGLVTLKTQMHTFFASYLSRLVKHHRGRAKNVDNVLQQAEGLGAVKAALLHEKALCRGETPPSTDIPGLKEEFKSQMKNRPDRNKLHSSAYYAAIIRSLEEVEVIERSSKPR